MYNSILNLSLYEEQSIIDWKELNTKSEQHLTEIDRMIQLNEFISDLMNIDITLFQSSNQFNIILDIVNNFS